MTTATSASNRTSYGFSAPCLATAKRSFGTTTEMPFRRCTLEMNADDRQIDHPPHGGHGERWLAGFARLIARQAWNALRHEPRLPPPYHRLGFAGSSHDLGRAAAFVGCKDDFGAPNMLLRRVAVTDNRLKLTAISRRDVDDNSCSHDESLNCFG